jgi:hypothetical protein
LQYCVRARQRARSSSSSAKNKAGAAQLEQRSASGRRKRKMNKIQNEINTKLLTIADRVVFSRGAVTAIRAGTKMDPKFFVQQIAEVLHIPVTRDPFVIVDCGKERDHIWASFLIEDYRKERCARSASRNTKLDWLRSVR